MRGCDDWDGLLSRDFPLFDEISSASPWTVAHSMNARNQKLFRTLSADDYLSPSRRLRDMSARWSRISNDIKGCCIADDDLVEKISDIAVVHQRLPLYPRITRLTFTQILLRFRDLHAAPALLLGIRNAGFHPEKLSPYWQLIDTTDNYAPYRSQYAKGPALPFPIPYTYGINPGRRVGDFFQFVSYFEWRQKNNEDDLCSYIDRVQAEGESGEPSTSGLWGIICNAIAMLASLLVISRWPRNHVRGDLLTRDALHSDIEKGLSGSQDFCPPSQKRDVEKCLPQSPAPSLLRQPMDSNLARSPQPLALPRALALHQELLPE